MDGTSVVGWRCGGDEQWVGCCGWRRVVVQAGRWDKRWGKWGEMMSGLRGMTGRVAGQAADRGDERLMGCGQV